MDKVDVWLKEKATRIQNEILGSFGKKRFKIQPFIRWGTTFKYQVWGYFKEVNFIVKAEVVYTFKAGYFLKMHIIMTNNNGRRTIPVSIIGEITNIYLRHFMHLKKGGNGPTSNRQMPFYPDGEMKPAEVVDVALSTEDWAKKKKK